MTATVTFFSQTVRSVKRTEPLILTIRFLVFDREPYRTKNGHRFPFIIGDREPHCTKNGHRFPFIIGDREPHRDHCTVRYGTETVRYGTDTVINLDAPLFYIWLFNLTEFWVNSYSALQIRLI